MLPAHIAENIRRQVLFYLQSTFDFRDPEVDEAFRAFVEDPRTGLFKGPWVDLRRPFRPAQGSWEGLFGFPVDFHPFEHQWRAWRRLSSRGRSPEATIVTTGTGSGKTECYLYPILDHCLRMREEGRRGIQAIILYPMNALASDQERRFAKVIHGIDSLRRAGIRVGNYTGRYDAADPEGGRQSGTRAMGPDHGITHHETQQDDPPDILLTNYKMLDFLLLRPQDRRLWRRNVPGVLTYLVLDELHTYDGAQGADVACLIRRLAERLGVDAGHPLCVVGTSATLDDRDPRGERERPGRVPGAADAGETGRDRLARFAGTLFDQEIPVDAVIGEDRLTTEELVRGEPLDVALPDAASCEPRDDEDVLAYAIRQCAAWGGPAPGAAAARDPEQAALDRWACEIGEWLRSCRLFRDLLEEVEGAEAEGRTPLGWGDLVDRLARRVPELRATEDPAERGRVLSSFLALIAQARELRSGRAVPLLPMQVQLWIRELRRLGRVVDGRPTFGWLDEPVPGISMLPTFHCSECGESGWVALHDPAGDTPIRSRGVDGMQLDGDPEAIYRSWFAGGLDHGQHIVVLSPWSREPAGGGAPVSGDLPFDQWHLCPGRLVLRRGDGPCPLSGETERFRVRVDFRSRKTDAGRIVGVQGCPRCESREGVLFVGSQSATLASVAIDEMFGSTLNADPKLLAFTDSVQDASHRAGFFTARTYNFTLRTALQHVVDEAGAEGVPLPETGARLLAWAAEAAPGRPGSIREAFTTLMPPDLQEYAEFLEYREKGLDDLPSGALRREIETRLTWQATREFGHMQTHGRTMEESGSASLAWDPAVISATIAGLRERLPGIDPLLDGVPDGAFRLWLLGLLHRLRLRGALGHPYLAPLARSGFWGKTRYGRADESRETYPPRGRYTPRLIATRADSRHEHLLAPTRGNQSPWALVWSRRALGRRKPDETTLLDLLQGLLAAGTDAGLFERLHADGEKQLHAISAAAARLVSAGQRLACSESGRSIVRPDGESAIWDGAPSLEYHASRGRYRAEEFSARQRYYQDRYRKGALRRVVAREHTGLLAVEEREELERVFAHSRHQDDPNVLTCTSTLEMGIDIGDLSSTMLCSIPPSTASFLQRIGRAGRATGTALIVSVVNQRPHDLFFYARPSEMLRGKVDPPGCWLDAAAVLARQYLAFCFDTATAVGVLEDLPRSGRQLVEDLSSDAGRLPALFEWMAVEEDTLRGRFLARFRGHVQDDTRERLLDETATERLRERVRGAAAEHDAQRRELENARKRLRDQLDSLDEEEKEARAEIERELRILRGRRTSLGRTSALEILTDRGLLPNYAFPERGVRFYGAIYNRHRGAQQEHAPVEVIRPAGAAIRELAPDNHFYTHGRRFEIQQIAVGNPNEPLVERWAICGACGHMRPAAAFEKAGTDPSCPQCHHGGEGGQAEKGQHHDFLFFPRSQALSYMEHYESLFGDTSDERRRAYYQLVPSFDLTAKAPSGAVGDDEAPFGIEYRSSVVYREVNAGPVGPDRTLAFGPGVLAPEDGFRVCQHCGVVVEPGAPPEKQRHRRSCSFRRRYEKDRQQGRDSRPFRWHSVFLFRELRSEAIRLFLPLADEDDIDTLIACIHLGLRLRFEGNPAHIIARPQVMPGAVADQQRHYLLLLDAVPGGTGYLKTLYQEKDGEGREGEGILDVLRRARDALETCPCGRLGPEEDTDGCYRCIRAYHLQYRAEKISRTRGIELLGTLLRAGERRQRKSELEDVPPDALYDSMLEKRFVEALRERVTTRGGRWEETIVRGKRGFRLSWHDSELLWDLELKPRLGIGQGVTVPCEPDFLLRSDGDDVLPIAIFTDGFEFHCHPHDRIADDLRKRRAILESGSYHVWSLTWDDLSREGAEETLVCDARLVKRLRRVGGSRAGGKGLRDPSRVTRSGFEQLVAFLEAPEPDAWRRWASVLLLAPLQAIADQRTVSAASLAAAVDGWKGGEEFARLEDQGDGGELVHNERLSLSGDLVAYAPVEGLERGETARTFCLARLGDTEAERAGPHYVTRWRRFLASLNLFQFAPELKFWATSEAQSGEAPDLPLAPEAAPAEGWREALDEVVAALRPVVQRLAIASGPLPVPVAALDEGDIPDDAMAELAWPDRSPPLAVLVGDQAHLAEAWRGKGWEVVTDQEIEEGGAALLEDRLRQTS